MLHPRDIFARNYRGDLLVDFGTVPTEPSRILNVLPDRQAEREKYDNLEGFDKIIKESGIRTSVRGITSNGEGSKKETKEKSIRNVALVVSF